MGFAIKPLLPSGDELRGIGLFIPSSNGLRDIKE
jgi:hypothetical protein